MIGFDSSLSAYLMIHHCIHPKAFLVQAMDPQPGPLAPVEFIRHCAAVGNGLSKADARRLRGLAEACKALLKERLVRLLQENGRCPLLLQYSGDCTPVHIREFGTAGSETKRRKISGSKTAEFYLQQVFATIAQLDGSRLHSVLLGFPLALQHGKTMAALLPIALACPGFRFPQEPGRIVILHQVHDRAMSQSFRQALTGALRGQLARYSAASTPASSTSTQDSSSSLLEWHCSLGCSCHDAHNALRWASQSLDESPEVLKVVHVAFICYRKGFMAAVAALGPWLAESVHPVPDEQLPAKGCMRQVYAVLGASEDQLRVLSQALPFWDSDMEKLNVSETFLKSPESISDLSGLLLDLWRFPSFSSSRWVSLGCSARMYSLSCLTGFHCMFRYMMEQGLMSEYDAAGGLKMGAQEQQWCLEVGLVSTLADSFLSGALSDSRVAVNCHALAIDVQAAFDNLEYLSADAWRLLSKGLTLPPAHLRHRVIGAAWVCLAHLDWRIFSTVTELPWSLLHEGPEAAVDTLLQYDDAPPEKVSSKAWTLLRLGHSRQDVQAALGLLRNVSWTSAFTEKQHASTKVVRKFHSDLSYEVMSARGYIHTVRCGQTWRG